MLQPSQEAKSTASQIAADPRSKESWIRAHRLAVIGIVIGLVSLTIAATNFVMTQHPFGWGAPDETQAPNVDILTVRSGDIAWLAAYNLDTDSSEFVNTDFTEMRSAGDDAFFMRELRGGAYSVGYLYITMTLEGANTASTTISNIRASDVVAGPVPAGPRIGHWGEGGGGGPPLRGFLNFEDDQPIQLENVPDPDGHSSDGALFDNSHDVEITSTDKVKLIVLARASRTNSFEFNISYDYAVGGQHGTQTIGLQGVNGATPFRLTASLCDMDNPGVMLNQVTPPVVHWGALNWNTPVDVSNPNFCESYPQF
ncbi:hypothetical protein Namu_2665 [Nakamurella multipartita DSM 44233]|uniref:Uncharacterized protein n=2 Tax=Nakamurella TaxID=53460 RepID=C8X8F6_NAKMY|nr:hypothetical protein Namu_2665 [Nakamurella multipartita DSM 44233]